MGTLTSNMAVVAVMPHEITMPCHQLSNGHMPGHIYVCVYDCVTCDAACRTSIIVGSCCCYAKSSSVQHGQLGLSVGSGHHHKGWKQNMECTSRQT